MVLWGFRELIHVRGLDLYPVLKLVLGKQGCGAGDRNAHYRYHLPDGASVCQLGSPPQTWQVPWDSYFCIPRAWGTVESSKSALRTCCWLVPEGLECLLSSCLLFSGLWSTLTWAPNSPASPYTGTHQRAWETHRWWPSWSGSLTHLHLCLLLSSFSEC